MIDTQSRPDEAKPHHQSGVLVKGVTKRFGSVEAVRGIDLEVPAGSVTALVGPNGAGKTTLLLMLSTLIRPDGGTISIGGHDPVTDPASVRNILGWSPDVFGTYDNLTAREYVEFFARAHQVAKPEVHSRSTEMLELARLSEMADRPVHTLSRGQKQRLGLTRALVHRPRVLLLDEPASGLDPRSRVELRDVLREQAAKGVAVLVSSHVLSDLEEVADRVVFVDDGRTVGSETMGDVRKAGAAVWRLNAIDNNVLLSALDELEIDHGQLTDGGVDVPAGSNENAARMLRLLIDKGVEVYSCNAVGGSLESAYLKLTEGRG